MKTKAAPPPVVADWEHANRVLHSLGLCSIRLSEIEDEMNTAIAEAKKTAEARAAAWRMRQAEWTDMLERFWIERRREVLPAKSRTLAFGSLGTRACKPAVKFLRGWNGARVIAALEAAGKGTAKFIRRGKPSIDKENVLKAETAELDGLRECGVAIETGGEQFFAEPDLVKLAAPPA